MSKIISDSTIGFAAIESYYTTQWIGQTDNLYYETSFIHGDYTGVRLGNSMGFLTAYPHATFATIGFNNYQQENYIYNHPDFTTPSIISTSYPPWFLFPPYKPIQPVPEANTLTLLLSALLVFAVWRFRLTRSCR